jgi:hypothetical protein
MSGKPAATAAAAKSAAARPAVKSADTAKAGAKPAGPAAKTAAKSAAPASDDPFDVKTEQASKAVRLYPQPKPGRQWQVVCPMCETPGYTAPQAAGKPVRCVNPKCLMPVFTAPQPEAEKPAEETPAAAGGLSRGMMAALAVLLLAAAGFAVWYFFLREDPGARLAELNQPAISDEELQRRAREREALLNPETKPQDDNTAAIEPPKPQEPSELTPQAIPAMQRWADSPGQYGPRDRPLSVQWIASAQIDLGDVAGARATLEELASMEDVRPANQVIPLVDLAWKQLADGQSADETVASALELAAVLRGVDQLEWQAQTHLAALLVALGRRDEAGSVLKRPATANPEQEQLWADEHIVRADETYDMTLAARHAPPLPPERSDWGAVALAAALHGHAAEALQWANAAPDLPTRSDALAEWAEALAAASVRDGGPIDLAPLEASLSELPEDERNAILARAEARVARRLFAASGKQAAEPWAARSGERIAGLPETTPAEMPGVKAMHDLDSRLPGRERLQLIAAAAAEAAHAQLLLGDATAAATTFEKALQALDAITPPTDELRTAASQANFVEGELAEELKLSNPDQIRLALNQYTRNALRLRDAGARRDAVKAALLEQAAAWGLGRATEAAAAPALAFRREIDELLTADPVQPREIARRINARAESGQGVPSHAVSRAMLEAACGLVRRGQVEAAFSLIGALDNDYRQADAALLAAALACKSGGGIKAWTVLEGESLETMTKLAGYRGFVAGAGPPAPEPTPSSDADADADVE